MNLSARITKLETLSLSNQKVNPFDEARYQEFEDWVRGDPRAKDLIKREFDYCMDKGYPRNDDDFYDELDDPLFWDMTRETLAAFDNYLKGRSL
jgi:hypothetical protein